VPTAPRAGPRVVRADDPSALGTLAARAVADRLRAGLRSSRRVVLALAGGTTPAPVYRLLAAAPDIAFDRVVIFLADERWAEASAPESNEGMVRRELLDRLPVPPAAFVSWAVGLDRDPEAVAADFADRLGAEAPVGPSGLPQIDATILGLGPEGHTASVFPASPLIGSPAIAQAVWVEAKAGWRLSCTPRLLASSGWVAFVVAGADKAEAVREVVGGPLDEQRWPAQAVARRACDCTVFCDRPAASLLPPGRS